MPQERRPYDSRHWRQLRKRILARDGHKCVQCGQAAHQVDHIIPWNQDNQSTWYEPSNLQSMCRSCHIKKTYAQPRKPYDNRAECKFHNPPLNTCPHSRDWYAGTKFEGT